MEKRQLMLLIALMVAFLVIYVLHMGSSCPVQSFATPEQTEGLQR